MYWLDVVIHICNASTWEADARGSHVLEQPGLHSEILSQKAKVWGTGGRAKMSGCLRSSGNP
jgi:hypothetical protein